MTRLAIALSLLIAIPAAAQWPQVPVPIFEPGLHSFPQNETIPAAALSEMFREELGKAYDPVLAPQLVSAHQLLENYFLIRTSSGRKAIVSSLEATKIDPNVLGCLCRIRSRWPSLSGGGVFYVNRKIGAYPIQYFAGVPKTYDRAKSWPVVIKLSAATPFLANPAPDAKQVVQIYTKWIDQELTRHPDALVLMPLLDLQEMWGPSYAGMNRVMQPLFDAADHLNIDPARVYLTGLSTGAQGAWNIALHYPTWFASVNPLGGSANADWQKLRLMNLKNVAPVVWHDDQDQIIKIGFAKSLIEQLRHLKIDVDFNETRDVGHVPTEQIVEAEYGRMRKYVRNLYPPQVWLQTNRPEVLFNRNDWVQIYQEQDTGKEMEMFFPSSSGHMSIDEKSCSMKADIHNNQIEATAENVDTLRFYVNDQMVDLAAPITVVVNKKQRFKGTVQPSIDLMLKDQLFIGRGWRYFTGAIDLELVDHAPTTRSTTSPSTHKGRIIVGPD